MVSATCPNSDYTGEAVGTGTRAENTRKKPGPWAWVSAGRISPLHRPLGAAPGLLVSPCVLTTLRPNALRPHYSFPKHKHLPHPETGTQPVLGGILGHLLVVGRKRYDTGSSMHPLNPDDGLVGERALTELQQQRTPMGTKGTPLANLQMSSHWCHGELGHIKWGCHHHPLEIMVQRLAVTREPSEGRKQSSPLQEWVAACRPGVCGESRTSAKPP